MSRRKLFSSTAMATLLLFALLAPEESMAGRTLVIPGYARRISSSYWLPAPLFPGTFMEACQLPSNINAVCTGANPGDPNCIDPADPAYWILRSQTNYVCSALIAPSANGAAFPTPAVFLSDVIILSNLSNQTQTGSISLLPGTIAQSILKNSSNVPITNDRVYLGLCSNFVGGHVINLRATPNPASIAPLNWTIAPNGGVTLIIDMIELPASNDVGAVDISLSPIVKIVVNEDEGAINGTISSQLDGATGLGAQTCGNLNVAGYAGSPALVNERQGAPILLNGGQPF